MPQWPAASSTAISKLRLRSASDMEKNSPCLPVTNSPPSRSVCAQWRRLRRKPPFIERQVFAERRDGRGPDATEMFAGIGLGILLAVLAVHGAAFLKRVVAYRTGCVASAQRMGMESTSGMGIWPARRRSRGHTPLPFSCSAPLVAMRRIWPSCRRQNKRNTLKDCSVFLQSRQGLSRLTRRIHRDVGRDGWTLSRCVPDAWRMTRARPAAGVAMPAGRRALPRRAGPSVTSRSHPGPHRQFPYSGIGMPFAAFTSCMAKLLRSIFTPGNRLSLCCISVE